ncbi:MAG: rhodanese-like domain-containing protein [Polyangiaceae bacterium]
MTSNSPNDPRRFATDGGASKVRRFRLCLVLRDAGLILLAGGTLGLLANLVHPRERLPWVATKPYDIVVPCPEPVGSASSVAANSSLLRDFTSLVIDARTEEAFGVWHWPGAINVPFDWLGPPVQAEVERLAKRVTATKAKRLVIYGDGDDPDSGREWARLLAGGGIRNVFYVEGGAPALQNSLAPASASGTREVSPTVTEPDSDQTPSAMPSSSASVPNVPTREDAP